MSRNVVESEFRTPKKSDLSVMARNSIENYFRISKIAAKKVPHRSEMARNVVESEFRT